MLQMQDGGETRGDVILRVQNETLCILRFSVNGYDLKQAPDLEQAFVLDALMRAAASYGENNGAAEITTAFPDFYDFLKRRGFKAAGGRMQTPMSTIVRYHQ